jgi:hypothetical protein
MAKRVSLKGKGADIFFGDYEPPAAIPESAPPPSQPQSKHATVPNPPPSTPNSSTMPASARASTRARTPARKQASTQDTKAASHTGPTASAPEPAAVPPAIVATVWQHLNERATVSNAFRYTDRELRWLTDALYDLGKRHGVRLTKQDIARLGLDLVLLDHQTRGEASLLSELARRRKQTPAST